MARSSVDICIVAGRRPDLLDETLASFKENLFDGLEVSRVIANIDPIFGDRSLGDQCVAVVKKHYGEAIVTQPETAGFTAAVQRNWMATRSDYIFHLEDDWRLEAKIEPSILDIFEDEKVAQIILHNWHLEWPVVERGRFSQRLVSARMFGIRMPWKTMRPMYATCPSFFRGSFVRMAAKLMDLRYDPDKQMKESKLNPNLVRKVANYRSYIYGEDDNFPMIDTGREWRISRGIAKDTSSGLSVWKN